ncbi:MAG: hypothetical protein ACK5P0_01205 [bacterium]
MADILLSTDDLTIFGGPETISLDLDIGPQGDRGSIIIEVNGDPRSTAVANQIVQETQALDLAIDTQELSDTYKTIFQKVSTGGSLQWQPMLSLKTNYYSSVKDVTAVPNTETGVGTLTIPPINVTEIYGTSGLNVVTENIFKIQYSVSSPESSGPLATNLIVKELSRTQGFLALPLEIKGVEYVNNAWQPMAGPKRVHLFITVV